jgi:hypothetical protein
MAASIIPFADIKPALKSSTARMQIHRKRKEIKRIQQIIDESSWTFCALQDYYQENDIPADVWSLASDLYESNTAGENRLDVKEFFSSNWDEFVKNLDNPGIERSVVKISFVDTIIIRPKFLGENLNQ